MSTVAPSFQPVGVRVSWWESQTKTTQYALIGFVTFAVFSLCRTVADQNALTSQFTITSAIGYALPILMAGLGGLVSERAGIVNIGLEGMMICGTWGAGFFGYHGGPWAALIGGFACGAIGGALHALATITFGVDHVVSGVALNLLAFGWARFLSASLFKGRGSGSETNSPGFDPSSGMPTVRTPGFGNGGALDKLEGKHWPIISDLAGLARGVFTERPLYQLIAIACVPLVGWMVWRTKFGLRLRSSGEKPSAADSLGVNVTRVRYQAVLLSGGLAGLGGALMVLNVNGQYSEGQTNGRGYTGLAALIFGNWRPSGVVAGSGLFGYLGVLEDTTEPRAVRGLYLFLLVGLLVALVLMLRRGKTRAAIAAGVGAALLTVLFVSGTAIDKNLYGALPGIGTLVVLVLFSRRLRPPAAAGMPWRKGQIT